MCIVWERQGLDPRISDHKVHVFKYHPIWHPLSLAVVTWLGFSSWVINILLPDKFLLTTRLGVSYELGSHLGSIKPFHTILPFIHTPLPFLDACFSHSPKSPHAGLSLLNFLEEHHRSASSDCSSHPSFSWWIPSCWIHTFLLTLEPFTIKALRHALLPCTPLSNSPRSQSSPKPQFA